MMIQKPKNKGRFAGIPLEVVQSEAFKSLKGNSVKLLVILASQYNGYNNGNLVVTESITGQWLNKNTMFKARDELYSKGFIVINAYGGRGHGKNIPHLYALTWKPINYLKNGVRVTHYQTNKDSLDYWQTGANPDIKPREERLEQFKKDIGEDA